jgi:cytochrome c5
MKMKTIGILALSGLLLTSVAWADSDKKKKDKDQGSPALESSEMAAIARGGRLYDHWPKESEDAHLPFVGTGMNSGEVSLKDAKGNRVHPSYPKEGKYAGKDGNDWRCKECHGWDYKGVHGAYASGDHHTGIKGIRSAAGKSEAEILKILQDDTHALKDTGLTKRDYRDLALFVAKGQVDMDAYIDPKTKAAKGDTATGRDIFETVCANCHGLKGAAIEEMEPLGKIANKNPWETLHKILNGQPKEEMPAMRAFGAKTAADILAHLQTLPADK